jgi:hypothetical protein
MDALSVFQQEPNAAAADIPVEPTFPPAASWRLGDLHFAPAVADAGRKATQVAGDRVAQGLARPHVELAAMRRAFDDVAVQPAVRQQGVGMGADVVGGEERAVHVVNR